MIKDFIELISRTLSGRQSAMGKNMTLVLSYFDQAEVLEQHLAQWESYSPNIRASVNFMIVDDCSQLPAKDVLNNFGPLDISIKVYRVLDDLYCNIAGGRNLGASECSTEWMLILDMDTMVPELLIKKMLRLTQKNRPATAYRFNRTVPDNPGHEKNGVPHPAVCLIRQKDYWAIGGCEVDLVGNYGYTDPCFWLRAKGKIRSIIKRNMYLIYNPAGESSIKRDKRINRKKFYSYKARGGWSNRYLNFNWRLEQLDIDLPN